MPQLKNMFIKGKMNLDLDERLVPKGEYRKAQNVLITNSEDSDVGAMENVRGNELLSDVEITSGVKGGSCIGSYIDVAKQRIYWFVTNFTSNNPNASINDMDRAETAASPEESSRILMREPSGQIFYIASGAFLNFTTTHTITGVNIVGNYLYWTDNYNQPRCINVEIGKEDPSYYDCEEKISVAKVAPFLPPFLHNSNEASSNANLGDTYTLVTTDPSSSTQHTKSEYMQEKFIRFAYRYKYEDNTYSIISPFTQHVFKPLNSGNIEFTSDGKSDAPEPIVNVSSAYIYSHNEVPLMKNAYDKVVMRIPIPTVKTGGIITEHETNSSLVSSTTYINELKINSIEILLREAGTASIQIVDTIDMINTIGLTFGRYKVKPKLSGHYYRQTVEYTYLARDPFKVLPEKQLIRVGDNAPVRAKAQEVVGSRLVYGNITLGYDLPRDEDNKKGVKFIITSGAKGENEVGYDADDIGNYFHNREQYKFHNIKQRRTYQVGIVLVDRYGRTSPVIPSTYKVDNLSDTHTVDAVIADLSSKFNSNYSWSAQHVAHGQALSIEFKDGHIVEETKSHSTTRPNGWYSWRLVVKQTEQDYYNIYTQHPMVNWGLEDSTRTDNPNNHVDDTDQIIKGTFVTNETSRSWFSLTNDNINKVPRSIKDVDRSSEFGDTDAMGRLVTSTREGIAGSEVKLYPKVVQITTANASNHFDSKMGDINQDYISVLSIGTAIEQGLSSLSNAKKGDVTGNEPATYFSDRIRPYSFLADNHKNPIVAEIPNLYLEPVAVAGEFNVNGSDVIRSVDNLISDMPFGYPNNKDKGLTVFETKPFESEIDIYYETSSCGLVRDLNEHCDYASNGPTNIQITPTFNANTFTPAEGAPILEEAKFGAQIGELTATAYNDGNNPTISSFAILGVNNSANDGNDLGKFSINYEDDKSYIKISPAQSTSSAADGFNLTTGGTVTRVGADVIGWFTSSKTSENLPAAFAGNGWYRVVLYQGQHASVNNNDMIKVVRVVNVTDTGGTNRIQSYLIGTPSTTNIPTNIAQKWMLKTNDLFAFYNDNSNDLYTLTIRVVQSNNVTGNGDLKVNITNSMPTPLNPYGVVIPSNTLPWPNGGILDTLVGINGSADPNNNGFGLTASLSGDDASSFRLRNHPSDGSWNLTTETSFVFADLFGTPSNGTYPGSAELYWNVVDNGNLTSSIAQVIGLTPVEVVEISSYHMSTEILACNNVQTSANSTYYATKNTSDDAPTSDLLFINNKIYTDAAITQTMTAGYIAVENGTDNWIPYQINSSGVVIAIGDACQLI